MEELTKSFLIHFDLKTGMSPDRKPNPRLLSQMAGMFCDRQAFERLVAEGDPKVYDFFELGLPETAGDIAFGTSITYPGKVGAEYFMTKGHFHTILDTAEVYYCLSGQGAMLMESPEGDVQLQELRAGAAVYVPKRYAHRSINTGNEPLVTFFAFRADAGHDYGTIETKGFRKLLVEQNGKPTLVDNPNWQEAAQ